MGEIGAEVNGEGVFVFVYFYLCHQLSVVLVRYGGPLRDFTC